MSSTSSLVDMIHPHLPLLLSLAAISTLLFTVITTVIALRIRKSSEQSASTQPEESQAGNDSDSQRKDTSHILQKEMKNLVKSIGAWRLRDIPWCLILGDSENGGETLLADSGAQKSSGNWLNWFRFQQGITLVPMSGLGDIGENYSQSGFTSLLKLMLRHKPRRPIDSLIITIPAQKLALPDFAEKLGESLQNQLAHLQETLGMRPPIYLLVTGCENLEGFSEICNRLSSKHLHQMFGWSSPYVPDATWSPDWIQEAEKGVLGALEDLRSEIFSKVISPQNARKIFSFNSHISNLFKPLKQVTEGLFRHSVYHEPFQFRGIWFCGCPAGRNSRGAVFVRDLISQKVFVEHNCAVPVHSIMTRRTNFSRAVQILTTVILCTWAAFIWHGNNALQQEVSTVLPVVETYRTTRNSTNISWWDPKKHIPQNRLEKMATRVPRIKKAYDNKTRTLLTTMEKAKQEWLTSIIFPTSFVNKLESRIKKLYNLAFDEIILQGITLGLVYKGIIIYEQPPDIKESPVEPLSQMTMFKDLEQHIADSAVFKARCKQFNNFKAIHNIEDLKEVLEYVFDIKIRSSFVQDKKQLEKIMAESSYQKIELGPYTDKAKKAFTIRMSNLYKQIFDNNPLLHAVDELVAALDVLTQNGGSYRPRNEEIRVEDDITAVHALLGNPEQAWPTKKTLPINWPLEPLFVKAASETPLRAATINISRKEGRTKLHQLFDKLSKKSSSITGPILVSDSSTLSLNPMVLLLQRSISDLQKQAFMHKAKDVQLSTKTPPATYLVWNIRLLEQAVDLAPPFDTYFNNEMKEFPSSFRSTVKKQGAKNLADNMSTLVAQAQQFVAMPKLDYLKGLQMDGSSSTNFSQAAPLLLRILDIYDQLGQQNERTALAIVVDKQAMDLLRRSNKELTRENLYSPKYQSLDKWNGKTPASEALFGLQSKNELKPYLSSQRDRLRLIATTWAEPALAYAYMREDFTQDDYSLLIRWEMILEDLNQYESHIPGNALSTLEQYVLHRLDNPNSIVPISGDSWFHQKTETMYKAVHNRLDWLQLKNFSNTWNQAADYFTQKLAGRFPFSSPYQIQKSASPDDIRTFLSMLPEFTSGNPPIFIQDFLDRMKKYRL